MFDGWSGDAANCGAATTCTLTLSSSRVVARASFSVIPTTLVSVSLGGTGIGSVSSNPAGISCTNAATSDCSENYRQGGMVTLTAAEANANNMFIGWGGACSGPQKTCTLMLTGNALNVVANFQPVTRSLAEGRK